MMTFYENTAPLGRGVTIEEVGNAAAFSAPTWHPALPGKFCMLMLVFIGRHQPSLFRPRLTRTTADQDRSLRPLQPADPAGN